jgi:hypothetical protein
MKAYDARVRGPNWGLRLIVAAVFRKKRTEFQYAIAINVQGSYLDDPL